MVAKRRQDISDTSEKSVGEALDSLNANLRQQGNRVVRQRMEATVENEAKRRRSSEKPASAGFKKI